MTAGTWNSTFSELYGINWLCLKLFEVLCMFSTYNTSCIFPQNSPPCSLAIDEYDCVLLLFIVVYNIICEDEERLCQCNWCGLEYSVQNSHKLCFFFLNISSRSIQITVISHLLFIYHLWGLPVLHLGFRNKQEG